MGKIMFVMICIIMIFIIMVFGVIDVNVGVIDVNVAMIIVSMSITVLVVLYTQHKTEERFLQQHKNDVRSEAQKTILEKEEALIKEIIELQKHTLDMFKMARNVEGKHNQNDPSSFLDIKVMLLNKHITILSKLNLAKYYSGFCKEDILISVTFFDEKYQANWKLISDYIDNLIVYYNLEGEEDKKGKAKLNYNEELTIKPINSAMLRLVKEFYACQKSILNENNAFKRKIRKLAISVDTSSSRQGAQ